MQRLAVSVLTLLLCTGGVSAQSTVPSRSLAPELADSAGAEMAYLHTDFASGTALFFPKSGQVLAALHTVLTPGDQIAGSIVVGLREEPLDNVVELHSSPIAQDPEHDLVLLQTVGTPTPAAPEPQAPAGENAHKVDRRRTRRPVHHRESASRTHPSSHKVPVHIVEDGPL